MYEAPIAYILNGLAAAAATSPVAVTTSSSADETPFEEWAED